EPAEQPEVGAEPLLGFRGEIMERLDAGVLMLGEIAEIQRRRFARGIAVDDDRAARLDPLDRRNQRRAAGAFENQVEPALSVADRGDDLGGTEPVQYMAAFGTSDDRGDPRAGASGELHREIADPASRAGDQH